MEGVPHYQFTVHSQPHSVPFSDIWCLVTFAFGATWSMMNNICDRGCLRPSAFCPKYVARYSPVWQAPPHACAPALWALSAFSMPERTAGPATRHNVEHTLGTPAFKCCWRRLLAALRCAGRAAAHANISYILLPLLVDIAVGNGVRAANNATTFVDDGSRRPDGSPTPFVRSATATFKRLVSRVNIHPDVSVCVQRERTASTCVAVANSSILYEWVAAATFTVCRHL